MSKATKITVEVNSAACLFDGSFASATGALDARPRPQVPASPNNARAFGKESLEFLGATAAAVIVRPVLGRNARYKSSM